MRYLKLAAILAIAVVASSASLSARLFPAAMAPSLTSVGPIQFGPDGVMFAADPSAATIYALDLGAQA